MYRNGFLRSLLNMIVVVSLLMGMLPFEVRAEPLTGEAAGTTRPASAPTPEAQVRMAGLVVYLPLVMRNYTGEVLEITLDQYAYPWLLLPGEVTTYALVVENPESYALESGELTAEVPDSVALVDGSVSDAGVYDAQAQQVRWTLPEITGGEALTVTFRAQVTASTPVTLTSWAQVTGTMRATRVVTDSDATFLSVGEATTQTLATSGGTLTVPLGDVVLTAPAGAVTQATQVRVAGFPVPPSEDYVRTMWFSLFDVTAVGDAGQALLDAEGHTHFLQPLTLTAQIPSTHLLPYLVHITGSSAKDYERKRIDVPGTLSYFTMTLQTFSPYGVGGAGSFPNSGAHYLMTNLPDTNLFSGAATYNYNLELPAGRRGLAPELSLNYNSGMLNGLLGSVQSSDVGLAWSLGGKVEIVREIGSNWLCHDNNCSFDWSYKNEFDLNIGGTRHELAFDEDWEGTGCRYYAEDAPGMLVMRYTAAGTENQFCGYPEGMIDGPPNITKEYWEVTTGDGTLYRLGYYSGDQISSEQITRMDGYNGALCTLDLCEDPEEWWRSFGGYAGEYAGRVAYRWSVDLVRDVYGNTIEYGYQKEQLGVYNDVPLTQFDRAQHLDWIRYGGNAEQGDLSLYLVDFVLEERTTVNDNLGEGTRHDDGLDGRDNDYINTPWSTWDSLRVDKIRVCANAGALECSDSDPLWQEYDLDYQFVKEYKFVPGPAHETTRLQTIIHRTRDAGGGLVQLPAPTFYYGDDEKSSFPHHYVGKCRNHPYCPSVYYPRLRSVENGYGGQVVFTYNGFMGDDRILCDEVYSYRVQAKQVFDGMGHTSRTEYSYDGECFYWGNHELSCDRDAPKNYGLGGHQRVTQEVYGYEDELLAKSTQHFHTAGDEAWRTGRAYRSEVYDTDASTLLQRTDTQWIKEDVGPTTFTYADVVTSTDYTGATPLTTRTEYDYDPAYQGDAQYGLLTQVRSYDSQDAVQRVQHTNYLVGVQKWLMLPWSKVTSKLRPDGTWPATKTVAFYLYDGNTDPDAQVLDKGALTMVRNLVTSTVPCPLADGSTVDTAYEYDVYGNVVTTTTYADYGEISCTVVGSELDWNSVTPGGGGSDARVSTIGYDEQYSMFPVEMCAAVGTDQEQCSGVEYYGVNGDAEACKPSKGRFGAVCREWGPNGSADESTLYHYDAFGRKVDIWLPGEYEGFDSPSQHISYYDISHPEWLPLPVGIWNRFADGNLSDANVAIWQRIFYDGLGRSIQQHSRMADWAYTGGGRDIVQYTQYDGLGRAVVQSVPYDTPQYVHDEANVLNPYQGPDLSQPQTLTDYDALGRTVQVTNPDGTAITTTYSGRTITAVDANGHQVRQTLDDLGRMVQVEEFTGQAGVDAVLYAATHYGYDIFDNLTTVTDTLGNVTTMSYDGLGRKLAMSDPDMGNWSYSYSPVGSLETQTDARGCVISFAYDPLERLAGKSYSGACSQPAVSYSYDEGDGYNTGMRTGMTYNGGSASYAYDVRGRVVTSTQTLDGIDSYTTTYTYDDMDRLVSATYPDDETVETTYDNAGFPVTLGSQFDSYVTGANYNELGLPTEMMLGNGTQATWAYWGLEAGSGSTDDFGRLAQIRVSSTATESLLLMDRQYEYDNVGNVTRQTDMADDLAFTYDELNRLVGVAPAAGGSGYSKSYEYDEIGNLTMMGGVLYGYDDPNHVHAVTALAAGFPINDYTYDANGNQIRRILNSGETYAQFYDAENRLTVVTETVSGDVTRFLYDGDGTRVAQVTDEGTTVYVGEIYERYYVGVFPAHVQRAAPAAPLAPTAVQTLTFSSRDDFLGGESAQLDLYDVEDSMQLLSLDDDFADGELNLNRWPDFVEDWAGVPASSLIESGGVLSRPYDGGYYNILSDVFLDANYGEDDFAIEVDYDLTDYAEGAGARVALATYCKVSESLDDYVVTWIQYAFNDVPGVPTDTHRIETWLDFTNGSQSYRVDVADTPYMQGTLGVQRTDGQVQFVYSDGITDHTVPTVTYEHTAGACTVNLIANTWPSTVLEIPYSVAFDNVRVLENNGVADWRYLDQGTWSKAVDSRTPETTWQSMVWHGDLPADTAVTLSARSCELLPGTPDNVCDTWQEQALASGTPMSLSVGTRRYLDVKAVLSTTNPLVTPVMDDLQIVYEPQTSAGHVTKYYVLGSQRVAMSNADGVFYLHGDHLGSTSMTTGQDGAVVSKQRYYPYGGVRDLEGESPTDFGFTGQRLDEGTGLMYYRARYYDPLLGRFVQADTIVPQPGNPGELNRYAYAVNNPLNFKDPNGHQVSPPESCGPICYTGTTGPYNAESTLGYEYAKPVYQPLTVACYAATTDYYVPDEAGVILRFSTNFEATPKVALVYAPFTTGPEVHNVWRLQDGEINHSLEEHFAMGAELKPFGTEFGVGFGFDSQGGETNPEISAFGVTWGGTELVYEAKVLGSGAEAGFEYGEAGDFYVITTGEKFNEMGIAGIRQNYIQRDAVLLGRQVLPSYDDAWGHFWNWNLAQQSYTGFPYTWKSTEMGNDKK